MTWTKKEEHSQHSQFTRRGRGKKTVTCFHYNNIGHYAIDCRVSYDKIDKQKDSSLA